MAFQLDQFQGTGAHFRVLAPLHAHTAMIAQLHERLRDIRSRVWASDRADIEHGSLDEWTTIGVLGEIHVGVWQTENALTVGVGGATRWKNPVTRSHLVHWMEDPEACAQDIIAHTAQSDPVAAIERHELLIGQLLQYLGAAVRGAGYPVDAPTWITRLPLRPDQAIRDQLVADFTRLYFPVEPHATPFMENGI